MTPAESIDMLVADGIIDSVVQRVKTGKEAEVFVVRKGEEYLAAKVYKERNARNFKNNAAYKEGRAVRSTRDARALAKNTSYGRKLSENDWMHTEHDALVTVVNAGVRAPKAELFYEGILLMELVLDANGQPAPRMIEVPLSKEEAAEYHRDIVGQIVTMLTCDLIHGDLSPFNILLAWNGPTIIDLPQVIKAAHNSQSEQFLVRDVRNVTEYFAKFAPELKDRIYDGHAIWAKYVRRELTPEYFPAEGEGVAARPIDDGRRRHQGRPVQQRPHAHPRPELAALAAPSVPQARPAAPAPPPESRPTEHTPRAVPAPQQAQAPRPPRTDHAPTPRSPRPRRTDQAPAPVSPRPPRQEEAPRSPRPPRQDQAPRSPRPPLHEQAPRASQGPRVERPQRPERSPRPPPRQTGPVIERVSRLVPAGAARESSPAGQGGAERSGGLPPPRQEREGSRFQQHHRHRRPPPAH